MSWQKFYATFLTTPRDFQIFSGKIGKITISGNQERSKHSLNYDTVFVPCYSSMHMNFTLMQLCKFSYVENYKLIKLLIQQ